MPNLLTSRLFTAEIEITIICFGQGIYSQLPKKQILIQILKHRLFFEFVSDPIFLSSIARHRVK